MLDGKEVYNGQFPPLRVAQKSYSCLGRFTVQIPRSHARHTTLGGT